MAQKLDKDDAHHDDNLHFCCNNYMLVLKIAVRRERSIAHHRLSLLFIALLDCTAMRRPSIFIMNTWFNKTFGDEGSIITSFIFQIVMKYVNNSTVFENHSKCLIEISRKKYSRVLQNIEMIFLRLSFQFPFCCCQLKPFFKVCSSHP